MKNHLKQPRAMHGALLAVLMGMVFVGTLFSQSLADLARQERARKAQERTPPRVYTNDDIAKLPPSPATPSPAPSVAPAPGNAPGFTAAPSSEPKKEGAPAEGTPTAAPGKEQPQPPSNEGSKPAEKTQADLEKEYRDRFAKLRDQLDYETKKLDVMQRELNLMQMQYYQDPNVALREQTFRGEINQRTGDLEKQKVAVEKAKQAIADLEEELRKNGLPPGWAR